MHKAIWIESKEGELTKRDVYSCDLCEAIMLDGADDNKLKGGVSILGLFAGVSTTKICITADAASVHICDRCWDRLGGVDFGGTCERGERCWLSSKQWWTVMYGC